MKKFLFVLVLCMGAICANAADLNLHYKGYADLYSGITIPQYYYDSGICYGLSTSHGVEMFDGLFVGAGVDVAVSTNSYYSGRYEYEENYALIAIFVEGRYNFLRGRKISPFVGYRIGSGIHTFDENAHTGFYTSPSVGCTFNFTEKFGLDVSLGYNFYGGTTTYSYRYGIEGTGNINGIVAHVGVHF